MIAGHSPRVHTGSGKQVPDDVSVETSSHCSPSVVASRAAGREGTESMLARPNAGGNRRGGRFAPAV